MNKHITNFFKSTSIKIESIQGVDSTKISEIEKFTEHERRNGMESIKRWSSVRKDWTPLEDNEMRNKDDKDDSDVVDDSKNDGGDKNGRDGRDGKDDTGDKGEYNLTRTNFSREKEGEGEDPEDDEDDPYRGEPPYGGS